VPGRASPRAKASAQAWHEARAGAKSQVVGWPTGLEPDGKL
jgi:hypothetical protein